MTSPFGTPPSGDPSGSLPPPPPSGPTPGGPPPPPPSPSRPITQEVPVTPGPASGPPLGEVGTESAESPGRGSTQVVDGPLRRWTPPNPLEPDTPSTDDGGSTPPWWVIAAIIGGAVVACFVVWFLTNTWLRNALPDGRGFWVPATALAAAGGLWGLLSGGAGAPKRAAFGAAAGAVAGIVGSFLLGGAETHGHAVDDTVLSGASLLRALGWGAFTTAAWAATLGAGSVRHRMTQVGVGAAAGGFISGAVMGLLAGTNVFGSSTRVVPTDLWFSVPIRDIDAEVTVLPLLIVAIGVPVALAAVNRTTVATVGRPLLIGALASLLVPIVGAAAGYTSDLDSARRDGTFAGGGEIPAPTLPDITLPEINIPDITLPDIGLPTIPAESTPATSEPSAPATESPGGVASTEPAVIPPVSSEPAPDTAADTTADTETTIETSAATLPADTSSDTSSVGSTPTDSTPTDSTPTDSTPTDSTPADSEPADSEPAGPEATVALPFDAGIPFAVAYSGTATNDNGEIADMLIAVGRPAAPADADEVWNGPSTCASDGAAAIPFIIQVTTTDAAVTYVDVRFSQGAVGLDAAADHPMTIEFHDPDGTTRCTDATGADTSNTPAFTAWPAQTPDAPSYAYGYFIVADYFADGEAAGEPAAVVSVVPIVNQVVTTTVATVDGATAIDFTDPISGQPAQALDLVP